MAEPKVRFKRDDGNVYPAWQEYELDEILTERNEPHLITYDAPQLSFTIEQGVIYPEDKKTNKRDFLMKDKDNKKFLLTELNDIIYNPANLKFGAIHRNTLGRGVVSPIYAIFHTDQNPAFIEGIVTNPKFIKSSLKYLEGTVIKLMTLKPRDFVKMKVWIPCLEEQQKIAEFLSTVDEVIAASEQEVANLETQKKAVMKKIFSQEVRFKREDGTDFPEWVDNELGSLCEPHARIGWQNLRTDEFLDEGDYYLVTGTDFVDGRVCFNTCHYIDKDRYEMDKNIQIQNGDILITKDGTLGKVAIVSGMDKPGTLNAGVFVLQNLTSMLDHEYFYQYLAAPFLLRFAREKSTGGTIQHLNQGVLVQFTVPIPCLEEQHLIADFLSTFDEAIDAAKKELELWKELKKGLLQQMFV